MTGIALAPRHATASRAPRRTDSQLSPARPLAAPAAFLVYLAMSMVFFGVPHHIRTSIAGYPPDADTSIWCLRWWPWAIAHGLNPFVSTKLWAPNGVDLTWVTSIPSLSLIGLPVTALAGSIVAYNVFCVLAPCLAAWSAFLLARHLTGHWPAALLAGCLYGFSAYGFGQGLGHLNLMMTCMVPLLLLVCVRRVQGGLSPTRCVALLALGWLVQFGISLEVFCSAAFFAAIAWTAFLFVLEGEYRRRLFALAREAACAMAIVAVLVSPFLYFLLRAMPHLPHVLNDVSAASADPTGFFVPTMVNAIGGAYFGVTAYRLPGGGAEQTSYLGLPLLLLMTVFFTQNFARRRLRAMLWVLLAVILCSLGPRLWISGTQTGLWLPWSLMEHVPLLRSALPVRFTLYVFLIAGLVTAFWISGAPTRSARFARLLLGLCAYLILWPNRELTMHRTPIVLPPFFDKVRQGATLGTDESVLMFPFGPRAESMIWQIQAGFRFRQIGGYTGLIPVSEAADPVLPLLISGEAPPGFAQNIVSYCHRHATRLIIAGPDTEPAVMAALRQTGWKPSFQDGVTLFQDPAAPP